MEKFKLLLLFLCLQGFCFPHTTIAQGVNITSGGSISVTGTASIAINNGDFVNNGTFIKDSETVTFSGNTASFILGTSNTDLNDLFITNTGGITTQLNQLTINNLTIASNCKFSIDPTRAVEVSGAINNSASTIGFILKSDATGTASLIHNTTSVPATVQRYISGNAEDWHFLSSPVSNQSISGSWLPSGTYGNGTGYDLYLWNEANSCWIYNLNTTSTINWNTVHSGSNFEAGRGYLYSVQETTPTKEFAGNLNNGTINYGLSYSSADAILKGFNLIGNPYPSAIDWKAASGWTRTALATSGGGYDMWIWNPAANNYGVYNSADAGDTGTNSVSRYIAAMQGYFVLASASGDLSTTNSVRLGDASVSWFKKAFGDKDVVYVSKVCLSVKSDAAYGFDEIQLKYGYSENRNGTQKLFSSVETAPSLYINYGNKNLSVNYLSNTKENPSATIMFKPGKTGQFTIDCDFNQDDYDTVMLEDLKTNYIQDMKSQKTYTYRSSVSDNAKRFVLHFGAVKKTLVNGELPAKVYSSGSQLIVDLTLVSKPTDITIYDLMGRLLLQQNLEANTQHNLSLNASTQILVAVLNNPDGSLSCKLLWE